MDETTRHEPDDRDGDTSERDGDTSDVVHGPVGSAFLKDPAEAARSAADLDALPSIEEDDAARPADDRP